MDAKKENGTFSEKSRNLPEAPPRKEDGGECFAPLSCAPAAAKTQFWCAGAFANSFFNISEHFSENDRRRAKKNRTRLKKQDATRQKKQRPPEVRWEMKVGAEPVGAEPGFVFCDFRLPAEIAKNKTNILIAHQ